MEIDVIKQPHVFSGYKSPFVRPGHNLGDFKKNCYKE